MRRAVLVLILLIIIGNDVGSDVVAGAGAHSRKICTTNPPAGIARCHAIILTDGSGVTPLSTGTPQGYGPANFRAAYSVQPRSNTTVGVVSAYDAPNIQTDLATYSRMFSLPVLPACTSASQDSCLDKLSQRGTKSYPATNSSWAVETSLDVESVHAMCPGCRIELIEASSTRMDNLATAVDVAVSRGAKVISNSYGGPESSDEALYDRHYSRPGITMVVSSGDSGYGTSFPAASPGVVAVGGTTLRMNGSRVTSETAWNGAGSGCSLFEPKPSWQHDKKCTSRSLTDVAADADPATGAAIYDSYANGGRSGWFTVGGTSLAAPLVAGIIASSGATTNQPAYLYSHATGIIRDINRGNNGRCTISYFCKALTGYDGPTGLGVLHGL